MVQITRGPEKVLVHRRFPHIFKSFFLFFFLMALPCHTFAEIEPGLKTVNASGLAVVTANNTALARDAALNDALRKAIEQAVGTMVSSETMVENYQVLSDNVFTKTQGYIKGYDIINESQGQGLYAVTVQATVAMGAIKDDLYALGLIHRKAEKPRVLFMIAEKNIGRKYYTFWWWGRSEYRGETIDISAAETALKEIFINKGFNVVDMMGSADTIEISDVFRVADLTASGAREIGKKLNAEVVVFGKAYATEGPGTPESAIGTYMADVTAQAVRVDDGIVLGASKGHGVSRNISAVSGGTDAIAKASSDVADKLIDQIIARWSSGHTVTLKINGITDYKKITDFKNSLKSRVRGITAIYQRKFEGGEAVFELDSKVPAQTIADEISSMGLPVKVTATTANTIEAVMEEGQVQ